MGIDELVACALRPVFPWGPMLVFALLVAAGTVIGQVLAHL